MPKGQAYQDPLRLGGRGADCLGEGFYALDRFDIDKSAVTRTMVILSVMRSVWNV